MPGIEYMFINKRKKVEKILVRTEKAEKERGRRALLGDVHQKNTHTHTHTHDTEVLTILWL